MNLLEITILTIACIVGFILFACIDKMFFNVKEKNKKENDYINQYLSNDEFNIQQDLIEKGHYDVTSFEEEELEEDDYHYDDLD